MTTFINSVRNGDVPSVRRATEEDPNLARARGKNDDDRALGDAAEAGHLEVVRLFVEFGANLERLGPAASAAARNRGDREMARYLRRVLYG